jgi:hypothetical protein
MDCSSAELFFNDNSSFHQTFRDFNQPWGEEVEIQRQFPNYDVGHICKWPLFLRQAADLGHFLTPKVGQQSDTVGGDANHDGNSTAPTPGWWRGIQVRNNGSGTIECGEHFFVETRRLGHFQPWNHIWENTDAKRIGAGQFKKSMRPKACLSGIKRLG